MKHSLLNLLLVVFFLLAGCTKNIDDHAMHFAIAAEYPPFEYIEGDKFVGFDIELAKLIAKELGKEAAFEDMTFASILAAVQNGTVDAGISTITVTPERQKNFDFSQPYYKESMAMLFPKKIPIKNKEEIADKKIACQLGTTLEIWLQKNIPNVSIVAMDNNLQSIEALKAGHVDGAFVDTVQASEFAKQNPQLSYAVIARADSGYSLAFRKGSHLMAQVDNALQKLEKDGSLDRLQKKYFKED